MRGKVDWWVNEMEVHSFKVSGPFVAHDHFVVQFDVDVTGQELEAPDADLGSGLLHR